MSNHYKIVNRLGGSRIVKRFAIFPILIDEEYRWLETVYIKQNYTHDWDRIIEFYWKNEQFVTKEKYEEYVERKKR